METSFTLFNVLIKVKYYTKFNWKYLSKWKKKFIGQNWYLGETLHSGIGQGYFQSTPLQLCLMTAQIANGGFEIKPRIIVNGKNDNLRNYLNHKNENPNGFNGLNSATTATIFNGSNGFLNNSNGGVFPMMQLASQYIPAEYNTYIAKQCMLEENNT